MLEFRTLTADEIDCRVNQISEKGLSLLLYKDARCDMNILDETVGCKNWMREHSRENANCTVSIWDEEKRQWIAKEDTGTESNTEAEKGLASDSFKRACVNWGIGRELYTAPRIYIPAEKTNIRKNEKGKFNTYDEFAVSRIIYDDKRNISALEIINAKTEAIVYSKGFSRTSEPPRNINDLKQFDEVRVVHKCADCGNVIAQYIGSNGKPVNLDKHIQQSMEKYGKQLCIDCIRKNYANR